MAILFAVVLFTAAYAAPKATEKLEEFRLVGKNVDGSIHVATDEEAGNILQFSEEQTISDEKFHFSEPQFGSDLFDEDSSLNVERRKRTVIGDEDRTCILFPTSCPYSAMGIVQSEFNDDNITITCSGFLVAPNMVITSAHCIYNLTSSEFADEVTFYRGQSCYTRGTAMTASRWFALNNYTIHRDIGQDIGFIILSDSYNNCYFGVACSETLKTFFNVYLVGYPLGYPSTRYPYNCMCESNCTATESCVPFDLLYQAANGDFSNKWCHMCDTSAAMSGGPITALGNRINFDSRYYAREIQQLYRVLIKYHNIFAIGVHNSGDADGPGIGVDCNWATQITCPIYNIIQYLKRNYQP